MATLEVISAAAIGGGGLNINGLSAAAALDGTEEVPVYQAGGNKKTTTQDIADLGGGGLGYLVYTALLSQSGTDAPVATVLANTLGGTVVWTRDGVGTYHATLNDAFPINNTIGFSGGNYFENSIMCSHIVNGNSANLMVLYTFDNTPTSADEFILLPVKIEVYP